jgi:hypothetical protein
MEEQKPEQPNKFGISQEDFEATLAIAKRIEAMHKTCIRLRPRDYIKQMQPYYIFIQKYKKDNGVENTIQAVLEIVEGKMKNRDIIWFMGTAAEILKNESGEKNTLNLVKPDGTPLKS